MAALRLRFAAGVFVLAAGLLMGGPVAVADPGIGGFASDADDGTNGPVGGDPVGNVTDTVRETVGGITSTIGSGGQSGSQQSSSEPTSTFGSGRSPGQRPSTGATSPTTGAGGTNTKEEKEDAGLVPAVPTPMPAGPNAVAPVTHLVAPVTDAVAPVTDVIAVAPVSDVIAVGQDVLTSPADAIGTLIQPPYDLSSFLLGIAGVQPEGDGSAGTSGTGLLSALGASMTSQLPLAPLLAGTPGVRVAGNAATRVSVLDAILLGRTSALSEVAPLAPKGISPMDEQAQFQRAFEFLLRASLWALAAAALPGVGGLAILIAFGVRVGYGKLGPDSHRKDRPLRDSPVRAILDVPGHWASSVIRYGRR